MAEKIACGYFLLLPIKKQFIYPVPAGKHAGEPKKQQILMAMAREEGRVAAKASS